MPGAREVVHHVLVYAKVPPAPGAAASTPAPRPAGTPAPQPLLIRNRAQRARRTFRARDTLHPPPRSSARSSAPTAPGNNVIEFPKGTALRLRAGTVLTFQMHYTAHGHEMKDRTTVGFRFAKEMPDEQIFASQFVNGSFTIPAGAKDVAVPAEIGVGEPVRIWGMMPHTHLRGTRWQYKLEKPDGTSEVILDVPHYDFNWQTYYMFAKPLEIPAGAQDHVDGVVRQLGDEQAQSRRDQGREVGRSDVGGDAVHGIPVQHSRTQALAGPSSHSLTDSKRERARSGTKPGGRVRQRDFVDQNQPHVRSVAVSSVNAAVKNPSIILSSSAAETPGMTGNRPRDPPSSRLRPACTSA